MKNGWQATTIGDVCEVIAGQSPEGKFYNSEGNGLPFYQGKKDFGERFIQAPTTWTTQTTKVAREGDILISVRAPVGPVNFSTGDVCIGRGLAAVRSGPRLNHEFLFYQLLHLQPEIAGKEGAVFASINKSEIEALPLSIAPMAEQQRLVGLLDGAFDGLATAMVNAEKNLQNARALFESHLQSVFAQRGPGWVQKRLADVAEFKNGLNFTGQSRGQTLRMVGVGDFQGHSVVPVETIRSVTIDGKVSIDYLIRRDDILMVRSNGSRDLVGRCMLVPDVDGATSFSGFIIRIRFDTSALSPRFLLYFMKSRATRDRLTRDGGGANISNINQAKLSELPVSFPSFKHQEEIAGRLDHLREESQRLARLYEGKLAALEALKKSLLHQAFSGAL